MSDLDEIRLWRAERAIGRVILEYARSVDQRDFDRVRRCFHEDAQVHYGDWFSGNLDQAIAFLEDSVPRLESTLHVFGTPYIEISLDWRVAECETYAVNSATYPRDESGVSMQNVSGTRYVDRFEFREERWAIAERRNRRVWAHNLPEQGEPIFSSPAEPLVV